MRLFPPLEEHVYTYFTEKNDGNYHSSKTVLEKQNIFGFETDCNRCEGKSCLKYYSLRTENWKIQVEMLKNSYAHVDRLTTQTKNFVGMYGIFSKLKIKNEQKWMLNELELMTHNGHVNFAPWQKQKHELVSERDLPNGQ